MSSALLRQVFEATRSHLYSFLDQFFRALSKIRVMWSQWRDTFGIWYSMESPISRTNIGPDVARKHMSWEVGRICWKN